MLLEIPWPFRGEMSLVAATKRITHATESDEFKPETNKIVNINWRRTKKRWIVCDGLGTMHFRSLDDPTKQIEEWAKLRDKGYITEEEFMRAKAALLDGFGM